MATTVCHWHPDRETGLRCSSCGKPICVECMRQHPVGIRCKECARAARLPTYQISKSYVARGVGAAVGLGLAGAVGLLLIARFVPFGGLFFFLTMAGLGYVLGEGVGAAVNRRRGRPYQYMALGAVLLATGPYALVALFSFSVGSALTFAGIAVAALVAWNRLRP